MRRISTLVAALALVACGPSENQPGGGSSAPIGASEARLKIELTSYTYGKFDGDLAKELEKVFSPKKWRGETDGPVLLSGASLVTLSDDQKAALKTILLQGHAILITGVTQEQLERAHQLIAQRVPSITLDPNAAPAELYVLAYPRERLRTLAIRSIPGGLDRPEIEARYAANAQKVADWFQEHVRATYESSPMALAGDSNYDILPTRNEDFPWSHSETYPMAAYYSATCSGTKSCNNLATTSIYTWTVHNPLPPTQDQPSDYVIARVTNSMDIANCRLDIGKDNRFAGYWLRQANVSANVPDITMNGYRLVAGISTGDYQPKVANPETTVNKGVSWSFGGSGTIGSSAGFSGVKPSAEVSKSLGFNWGVSYTNSETTSYPAVATLPKIPADVSNPTKVLWTYDAWHFISNMLEPGNHACGGPGLNKGDLPPIVYGSSFPSQQEFVWMLKPEVRRALGVSPTDGYTYLPVQVDYSLLLGWAFYQQTTGYCDQSNATGYHYNLNNKSVDIVGLVNSPPLNSSPNNGDLFAGDGLAFDPGCGTVTKWGTIPLGDREAGADNHNSVTGNPYPFPTMAGISIPLAPDPRQMTLESISPTRGPMGAVVTLRGNALNTATSVNFGGQAPASQSLEFENGVPVLTVTAPALTVPAGYTVRVSVQNAVVTTDDFDFVYTGMPR